MHKKKINIQYMFNVINCVFTKTAQYIRKKLYRKFAKWLL